MTNVNFYSLTVYCFTISDIHIKIPRVYFTFLMLVIYECYYQSSCHIPYGVQLNVPNMKPDW